MPTVELTAPYLKGIKADPTKRVEYRDGGEAGEPGLVLRVTPNGEMTWSVWYRVHGTARRLTLGPLKDWSLKKARDRAAEVKADARRGTDAVAVKAEKKEQARQAAAERQRAKLRGETLEALAKRAFGDEKVEGDQGAIGPKLRPRSLKEYRRALKADVLPKLGKLKPEAITRADIKALIAAKAKDAPIQANRTLAAVRRLFAWAVKEELLGASPCTGVEAPSPERPRERVYTDKELRALVQAASGTDVADLLGLLLRTATRSEETRAAKFEHMDFERGVWTIPAESAKNDDPHPVALSKGALAILKARRAAQPDEEFVFPSKTAARGFMSNPHVETVDAIRTASGVADFTWHDVRRTVATRLAEDGTPVQVIEAVLGHRPPKLVRTYQRHAYLPEMQKALDRWDRKLASILAGERAQPEKDGKVAPFKRRA